MGEVAEMVVGVDEASGADELVWVVAEPEPAMEKKPLTIKITIDPEVLAKSKALTEALAKELASGGIFERLAKLPKLQDDLAQSIASAELGRAFVAGAGVAAAGMRLRQEYRERPGRMYPLCGPHREAWTVSGRYLVERGASPFISDASS